LCRRTSFRPVSRTLSINVETPRPPSTGAEDGSRKVEDIVRVHETATAWKGQDPMARSAADAIREQVQQRHGIDGDTSEAVWTLQLHSMKRHGQGPGPGRTDSSNGKNYPSHAASRGSRTGRQSPTGERRCRQCPARTANGRSRCHLRLSRTPGSPRKEPRPHRRQGSRGGETHRRPQPSNPAGRSPLPN
jgi:hypothetical protein